MWTYTGTYSNGRKNTIKCGICVLLICLGSYFSHFLWILGYNLKNQLFFVNLDFLPHFCALIINHSYFFSVRLACTSVLLYKATCAKMNFTLRCFRSGGQKSATVVKFEDTTIKYYSSFSPPTCQTLTCQWSWRQIPKHRGTFSGCLICTMQLQLLMQRAMQTLDFNTQNALYFSLLKPKFGRDIFIGT